MAAGGCRSLFSSEGRNTRLSTPTPKVHRDSVREGLAAPFDPSRPRPPTRQLGALVMTASDVATPGFSLVNRAVNQPWLSAAFLCDRIGWKMQRWEAREAPKTLN